MYVCTCYSAPTRFLLRGAPDYCADAESEFHVEAHEQLRVKDLPRVPTRRLLPSKVVDIGRNFSEQLYTSYDSLWQQNNADAFDRNKIMHYYSSTNKDCTY